MVQSRVKIILILLISFLTNLPEKINAQQDNYLSKDTTIFCFKYRFNLYDTLIYFAHSYDSIVIDYGTPLMKVRNEIFRVICENITPKGTYILKYKLIEFRGRDIQDTTIVDYTDSDWLGREVKIEIDSLGNRLNFWVDDTLKSGRAPGGPFQPQLFFTFQDTCKRKEETWLVRATDDLAENGIPIPRLRQTILYKMVGEIDTLGEKVIRSEFIRTGQGFLKMQNPLGELTLTTIINSYGYLDISKEKLIPIHIFTTDEQKLNITSSDTESTGKHYIYTNYTLVDYKKGIAPKAKPQKKKPRRN